MPALTTNKTRGALCMTSIVTTTTVDRTVRGATVEAPALPPLAPSQQVAFGNAHPDDAGGARRAARRRSRFGQDHAAASSAGEVGWTVDQHRGCAGRNRGGGSHGDRGGD